MGILGTTGVATGMALRFLRVFLAPPGFFGLSLSSDELSVSESEYSEQYQLDWTQERYKLTYLSSLSSLSVLGPGLGSGVSLMVLILQQRLSIL